MEINGQNVEEKTLEDVILLMKEGGSCLSLLVTEKRSRTETPIKTCTNEVTDMFSYYLPCII